MAEHSRFWNSSPGDVREYQAAEFAEYFSRFLSDGIYVEGGNLGLRVNTGSGLQVVVSPGFALIRGVLYHNDANLTLNLSAADSILDRIDRIVLRFDEVNQEIKARVLQGGNASSPTAPSITEDGTTKELTLAQVRVNKQVTSISTGNITDERLSETCGIVSLLANAPLDDLLAEWEQFKSERGTDYQAWLATLSDALSGNVAENLLGLIDGHKNDDNNPHEVTKSQVELGNVDNVKQMPLSGGTFTGVAKAQTNTNYTTAQLRNVILSTSNANVNSMNNGDIWIKYS